MIDKAHLLWGIVVILGFSVWQFIPVDNVVEAANLAWIPLALIGVGGMFYFIKAGFGHKVVAAWTVISVVGMIISLAMGAQLIDLFQFGINFGVLWGVLMAIGYVYTGMQMKVKPVYYVAAVALFIVSALIYFQVGALFGFQWAFVPLGLAAGLPLLYESWFS